MEYPLHYPFILTDDKARDILVTFAKLLHINEQLPKEHRINVDFTCGNLHTERLTINSYGHLFYAGMQIGHLINANTYKLHRYGYDLPKQTKRTYYQFSKVSKLPRRDGAFVWRIKSLLPYPVSHRPLFKRK